jgi:nucleotide-binding universal stress UspA family protein
MTAGTGSATGKRIVVGVDGSGHSQDALRWGAHLAAIYGAQLDAVTAWEYPASYGWASVPQGWNPGKDMQDVLQDTVHKVFGDSPPAGIKLHVGEGSAAKVLIEESVDATMLIVGSRGHGGFAGLLLGSVSANVAEHAECPVLIIHGDEAPPAVA